MRMNEIKKRVELFEDIEQALDNIIHWASNIEKNAKELKQYNDLDDTDHERLQEVVRGAFNPNNHDIEQITDAIWLVDCQVKTIRKNINEYVIKREGADNES